MTRSTSVAPSGTRSSSPVWTMIVGTSGSSRDGCSGTNDGYSAVSLVSDSRYSGGGPFVPCQTFYTSLVELVRSWPAWAEERAALSSDAREARGAVRALRETRVGTPCQGPVPSAVRHADTRGPTPERGRVAGPENVD